MRVLSVIHYPTFGGPHNRNASFAPELASRGIDLIVLLPDDPGNAASRLRALGMDVVRVRLGRVRASVDPRLHVRFVAQFRSDVRRLRATLRSLEIDLVLLNGLVNPHAALAARLEGLPLVWQLLDTFAPMPLRLAMMPFVVTWADAIMSSGMAVARAHPGAVGFEHRLVSFFPGVDSEAFRRDDMRRRAARQELGFDESDLVVGNVSNINPMKGHRMFIRAAAELRQERPDVRFAILGAVNAHHRAYVDGLWEEASGLGLVPGRDLVVRDPGTRVAELASAFDVFWLTSEPRSEGLSTVAGEAMALEIPVIATDVGALRESVRHGETGFLVPPRDAHAMALATQRLLDEPDLRARIGRQARSWATQCYAPASGAELHRRAFEAAIEHCARR